MVMIDSAVLSNLDINDVLNSHIESGRDITVVTKAGVANGQKQLDLALKLDDKGEVVDMVVDYAAPAEYHASMDIFVLSKKWLIRQVQEHIAHNLYHMDRDLVLGLWQRGEATVNVYTFRGKVMFNESVEEYFRNSLALTQKDVRYDLFHYNHPVYTRVRDRVPTYYGENCKVENCIVADGCMLDGNARNSVLFRQVTVYPGAKEEYQNYPMFIIDGTAAPYESYVTYGEKGKCLTLKKDGAYHERSGIYGSNFPKGQTGLYSFGDGLYYVSHEYKTPEKEQGGHIKLYRRAEDTAVLFEEITE